MTDPVANPFDSTRGWYASDRDLHYAKTIVNGIASTDPLDLVADRNGSGNEQDGFRINEVLGVYSKQGLLGGNTNDPGFGLVIRERPAQATHYWSGGLPDPSVSGHLPWASAGADTGTAGPFEEAFGMLCIEVEHAHAVLAGTTATWTPTSSIGGLSGSGMAALPDNGNIFNAAVDYTANSPRLDFQVQIASPGTWYVHVRGAGPDSGGDSCHIGLNGLPSSSADRVSLDTEALAWTNQDLGGQRLTLTIPTAGTHTITLWMREDGAVVDKLVLTTDVNFSPSGTGPTESASTPIATQAPYLGSPTTIAAVGNSIIQAEHYDNGGLDVSVHDANATNDNVGTTIRSDGEDWDLATNGSDTWIDSIQSGDWYEYTISVAETGTYDVTLRTGAPYLGGGTLHIEVAGTNLTGSVSVPQTAGIDMFTDTTVTGIPLAAGEHTLRLVFNSNNISCDRMVITRAGDFALHTEQLADYLKSQYQVYFGTTTIGGSTALRDITELFFDCEASSAASAEEMVAFESWVQNRRETGFMGWMFDIDGDEGIPLEDFRVNWLTLNMDRVCAFMRNTALHTIDPAISTGDTRSLAAQFNGMVLVSRTRRSNTLAMSASADFTQGYQHDSSGQPLLPHGYHPIWNPDWARPKDAVSFQTAWNNGDWIAPPHFQTDPFAATAAHVRCGNGPDATFHNGLRLRGGTGLHWGGTIVGPDGNARARGTTVICANPVFIQGDYNATLYNATGTSSFPYTMLNTDGDAYVTEAEFDARPSDFDLPAAAVFCDSLSVLSNAWVDESIEFANLTNAQETWYNTSVVTNNVPTYLFDGATTVVPSGGPHNLIRYLESWSGKWYHIKGSTVVMGVSKFTLAEAGWSGSVRTSGERYYRPPNRDIQFNTDLFTRPGQPPFTPFGVTVIRTVQTVNLRELAVAREGE